MMRKSSFLMMMVLLGLWVFLPLSAQELISQDVQFKRAVLLINGQKFQVEYADTWELRARGLMYRTELCQQCGMLFKFDRERLISMWMKNTFIPLDVAFFKKNGEIVDIKQMQPLDLTSVPSSKPVLYALEMNEGWFAANGVKEGNSIEVLETGTIEEIQ
ncbi:DUF192 domain-containing protein [Planctobacterium marinum]